MKINNINGSRSFQLANNQVLTFDIRQIQIHCLQGLMWVTWPDGNERVLQQGQTMTAISKGKICLQAFSDGAVIARNVENRTPSFWKIGTIVLFFK